MLLPNKVCLNILHLFFFLSLSFSHSERLDGGEEAAEAPDGSMLNEPRLRQFPAAVQPWRPLCGSPVSRGTQYAEFTEGPPFILFSLCSGKLSCAFDVIIHHDEDVIFKVYIIIAKVCACVLSLRLTWASLINILVRRHDDDGCPQYIRLWGYFFYGVTSSWGKSFVHITGLIRTFLKMRLWQRFDLPTFPYEGYPSLSKRHWPLLR